MRRGFQGAALQAWCCEVLDGQPGCLLPWQPAHHALAFDLG